MIEFEIEYFSRAYRENYIRRNPPNKWRSFLKEILKFKTEGNLLDVGCAHGLFLYHAMRKFKCSGCDISHFALSYARSYLPPEVNLFYGAIGNITVKRPYDVVTCFDVLEHIENLEVALKNLYELVYPRGLLVLTVPVYDGPLGWLVNRLDYDLTHQHRQSRDFWLRQVERWFEVRFYTGVWRYFLLNRFYFNTVSHMSRRWTTAILIVAEGSTM